MFNDDWWIIFAIDKFRIILNLNCCENLVFDLNIWSKMAIWIQFLFGKPFHRVKPLNLKLNLYLNQVLFYSSIEYGKLFIDESLEW